MMYAKIWRHGIDIAIAYYNKDTDEFISSDMIPGILEEGVVTGKPLETDPLKLAIDDARFWGCNRIDIDLS